MKLVGIIAATLMISGCVSYGGKITENSAVNSYGVQSVSKETAPVKSGEKSIRFEVRKGDCQGKDCATNRERVEIEPNLKIFNGQKTWFGTYFYVPEDAKFTQEAATSILQIFSKAPDPNWVPIAQIIIAGNTLQTQWLQNTKMRTSDGSSESNISTFGFVEWAARLDKIRGKWNQLVVYFDSSVPSGLMQIYLNGKLIREIENPAQYPADEYFGIKYGLYRSHLHRERGVVPTSLIYFDETRIGKSREEVDDILNPALTVVD